MKVLVINAGSSSIKYQLIETDNESVIAKGICERIGLNSSTLVHSGGKLVHMDGLNMPTHVEAMKYLLDALIDKTHGVINSMSDIAAIGHRVLLSGEDYDSSVLIDDRAIGVIKSNINLGPLHIPANLMGIEACRAVMPSVPMAAVFDNTFHSTMPDYAYMYAIDYDDYKKYKLRKYGFHGTSHMYVSGEAQKLLGKKNSKIVVCHLGNGASVSAVKDGKCIDTSMGLTPLEGLVMGTRCGDIDAAAVEYLMDKKHMDIREATSYLNKRCGVLGVSGVSSDFRDLSAAVESGNDRARLAVEMFAYRVKKYVGSYAAAMGGLDCIAFTGGVGEHSPAVRELVMTGLEFLGVKFDKALNENVKRGAVSLISGGKTKVYIIPTNEELVIARETRRLIAG
ncbi:MAG: acetate kinase [Clostridiales bacterium]|jgi:acetate kinase|nr:acetate kinase [Clostridiales bacterium]